MSAPVAISASRPFANLRKAVVRLQRQKSTVLAEVQNWTEGQRHFRPDPSSWCALEVVDHLVKVEYESVAYMRSRLMHRTPVGVGEKIRAQLVFAVMRSPLRIKVPTAVLSVLPDASPKENEIVLRWKMVRDELEALINRLEPDHLTSGVFHHPVSGPMTMMDAMTFLSAHITHHGYQLGRLRKARAWRIA